MKLFDRGKTFLAKTVTGANYGPTNQYEGLPVTFYDYDPDDRGDKLSGMEVHAICCRNDTGGDLVGGELVTWTTAFVGRRAGAKATDISPTEGVAGVVDDFLAASGGHAAVTVADGDLFWLIQKGPCRVLAQDSEETIAAGKYFTAEVGESGRVLLFDGTQTNDTGNLTRSIVGRALELSDTAAITANGHNLFRAYVDTGH